MLKTVSSITNAIGALNYQGTWNASTNTPALASSVGTKGDYYVVSVAGSTNLNGTSNWGVGDLATFNGSVWQRVEGGADGNFVNLSVSSTSTLSGLTASTALALNASKEIVSVTNTGTGDNVLATVPTLVGDVTLSTGNLVIGTAGKGVDFTAAGGDVLSMYDEGNWTPTWSGGTVTVNNARFTRVGRVVTICADLTFGASADATDATLTLPFNVDTVWGTGSINYTDYGTSLVVNIDPASDKLLFRGAINGGNLLSINIATKRVIFSAMYFA